MELFVLSRQDIEMLSLSDIESFILKKFRKLAEKKQCELKKLP